MIWLSRRVLHAGPNAEETEELSPSDPYDNLAKGAEA
jgi:cytochrome d ubiquinol oxidase subunit I